MAVNKGRCSWNWNAGLECRESVERKFELSEAPVQTDFLELDLRRYELRRGSSVLKLEKIPMELLILLVERRDQLVGREEIIARLWGKDVFLDTEQGINTAIRKIRLTLGDDPNDPRFLQTIVGKGYRFVEQITVVGDTPAVAAARAPGRTRRESGSRLAVYRVKRYPIGRAGVESPYPATPPADAHPRNACNWPSDS